MAKDSFGFGKEQIEWNDPWSDNIVIPSKNGKRITGKEAEKYDIYGSGFEGLLYKGHTLQKIDPKNYSPEEIKKLMEWYAENRIKTLEYLDKYSDDQKIVAAQNEKLNEIQHVIKQFEGYDLQ